MNKIKTDKTKLNEKIAFLEKQSEIIKAELEDELFITKKKVTDLGKIALGIGAGIIFTAIVLGSFGSGKGKKKVRSGSSKRVYQRFLDQLTAELTERTTDFILGVAKDKLLAFSDKTEKTEKDDSEFAD